MRAVSACNAVVVMLWMKPETRWCRRSCSRRCSTLAKTSSATSLAFWQGVFMATTDKPSGQCCHDAQQGRGLADRHLLHEGLSIGLQDFLLVDILVHDGSTRLAHSILHHHLRHGNWAFHSSGCLPSSRSPPQGSFRQSFCRRSWFSCVHHSAILQWPAQQAVASQRGSIVHSLPLHHHALNSRVPSCPAVTTTACRVTNLLAVLRGCRENQEHLLMVICEHLLNPRSVTFTVTLLPWLRNH